jgi:hypothetical protein
MGLRLFCLHQELFKAKWPEPHLSTPPFVTFVITTSPFYCRILSISCGIRRYYIIYCPDFFKSRSSKNCVRKAFFAPANGRGVTKSVTKN